MLSDGVLFKFNVGTLFPFGGFFFSPFVVITVTFIVVLVFANMCSNMIRLSDFRSMESIVTSLQFSYPIYSKSYKYVQCSLVAYINEHQMCILAKFNLHQKHHQVGQLQPKCENKKNAQWYRSGIVQTMEKKKHYKKEWKIAAGNFNSNFGLFIIHLNGCTLNYKF